MEGSNPLAKTTTAVAAAGASRIEDEMESIRTGITSEGSLPPHRKRSCMAVTRVHCKNSAAFPSIQTLIELAQSAIQYSDRVLICIGVGDAMEHKPYYDEALVAIKSSVHLCDRVIIQPICPWGAFTPALNISVAIAAREKVDVIIFQSLEVRVSPSDIHNLMRHLDGSTLVVGPVLDGHQFLEGEQVLRGRTCPWNTLALWNTAKLSAVGFPLMGDGLGEPTCAGVEEVSAVAFAQIMSPGNQAKLVKLAEVAWNTTAFKGDPERERYHELKMASKDERPQRQFQRFGITETGTVIHINFENL